MGIQMNFYANHEDQKVFEYNIIINVLVSYFCFIWIPMLWIYGHYNYFYSYSAGIDLRRQNLKSTQTSEYDSRAVSGIIYIVS